MSGEAGAGAGAGAVRKHDPAGEPSQYRVRIGSRTDSSRGAHTDNMSSVLDSSLGVLGYLLYRESLLRSYLQLRYWSRGWPWDNPVCVAGVWDERVWPGDWLRGAPETEDERTNDSEERDDEQDEERYDEQSEEPKEERDEEEADERDEGLGEEHDEDEGKEHGEEHDEEQDSDATKVAGVRISAGWQWHPYTQRSRAGKSDLLCDQQIMSTTLIGGCGVCSLRVRLKSIGVFFQCMHFATGCDITWPFLTP